MPNWVFNTMTVKADYVNKIINADNKVDFELTIPMPKELDITDGSTNQIAAYYYLSHRDNLYYQSVGSDPEFIRYYTPEINLEDMIKGDRPTPTVSGMALAGITHQPPPDLNMANSMLAKAIEHAKRVQERCSSYLNNIKDDDKRRETEDALYNEGKTLITNIQKYGHPTWYHWRIENWGCKWNASTQEITLDPKTNEYTLKFDTPWGPPENWIVNLCTQHHIPFHLDWLEEQGYRGTFDSDGTDITIKDLEPLTYDDEEDEGDDDDA